MRIRYVRTVACTGYDPEAAEPALLARTFQVGFLLREKSTPE